MALFILVFQRDIQELSPGVCGPYIEGNVATGRGERHGEREGISHHQDVRVGPLFNLPFLLFYEEIGTYQPVINVISHKKSRRFLYSF